MGKRMPCSDELKDKHLDMMLQMAYKYENALKSQQMLDELEEAGKECSEADARDAFALFLKKCQSAPHHPPDCGSGGMCCAGHGNSHAVCDSQGRCYTR